MKSSKATRAALTRKFEVSNVLNATATYHGERTTMRTQLITLLALAGTGLLPGSALAGNPALIGMDRVLITVETPPDELARFGLNAESLKAAVRDGLRAHVGAAGDTMDVAHLHLDLNPAALFFSWGVRLELERALPVDGQPGAYTRKVVWSDGRRGGTLLPQEAGKLLPLAKELAEGLSRELAQARSGLVQAQ